MAERFKQTAAQRRAQDAVVGVAGLKAMRSIARQVVPRAKIMAPKDTGEGADSITYRTHRGPDGVSIRIGWDRKHFYMLFPEIGTSEMPARPFLRPALEGPFTITR